VQGENLILLQLRSQYQEPASAGFFFLLLECPLLAYSVEKHGMQLIDFPFSFLSPPFRSG
jgi:hypothetical protein